jgi:PAS domain S-box-containing protein
MNPTAAPCPDGSNLLVLRRFLPRRPRRTVLSGWLFAGVLCLLLAGRTMAAGPQGNGLHVRRLSVADGLPTEQVLRIFQDSRGFLWFGTADGLARYDSHEFRVFRPDPRDPHALGNGFVSDIQEDRHGNLWVATLGGLDLWHRDTEQFSHYRHDASDTSLSSDRIRSLALDPDGSLWVGTVDAGLNRFDPRSGTCRRLRLPLGENPAGVSITCLLRDRQGVLWMGTVGGGLVGFDPRTDRLWTFAHDPLEARSLGNNHVSAIAEDAEGRLWVGTHDGLSRLDTARRFFERFAKDIDLPGALQSAVVDAVAVDRDGSVWVGTDGGGLSRLDPATRVFVHYRHSRYVSQTLASDAVRTIYQDESGDIWVGHFPDGVSHLDRLTAAFRVFHSVPGEPNTLPDEHVLSLLEDVPGGLWVGTDKGGLCRWSEETERWTCFEHDPHDRRTLGANAVFALLRDHGGRLWVGTWGGGLNALEERTSRFRRYLPDPTQPRSLASANIRSLVEDRQHRLWVATSGGGLHQYLPDQDGFLHYRHDPSNPRSLNSDFVSSLLVTRDGTLWAGTTAGLARWAPASQDWDRFESRPGVAGTLSNDDVIDLLEDHEGVIWVSTGGGGLNRLDPRTMRFESIRGSDGLPSDVLRGLVEDDDGMLWVASNRGLARFDPHTRHVRVFDENDGLPGRQFSSNGRLKLRSGELVFGTTQGFVRFAPRALQENTSPPRIVLTGFEVFGQPVAPGSADSLLRKSITETRRLELPARISAVSFQFAAFSYRSSARNQYRFMLEGFDGSWRTPGPERRATYTNLDPGRYRLRVRAANNDGVWNETGVALELIVVPPWWRTLWFRTLAALALLAGASTIGWATSAHRSSDRLREADRERAVARERERAAAAIRQSETKYRELVELANSIILRWSRDGRVLFLNEFGQRFFGYSEDELRGRHVVGTIVPEADLSGGSLPSLIEGICADPAAHEQSVNENIRRNGERVWVNWTNKVVLNREGEPSEILSIGVDITARRRMEEELRETQASLERRVAERTAELAEARDRAEAADRLKSAFLATMSHELRTPLNSIIGFTGILAQKLAGPLNAEQAKQLGMVQSSARHLLALINDVLDISKIEAGQLSVVHERFDAKASIFKVADIVRPLADRKGLALRVDVAPEVGVLESDQRRVEQVLLNLLNNAVKFTERGVVTVTAETIPGRTEGRRPEVRISVSDTGIGIKPEDLGVLFQPFRQIDTGLTRNHEGTGLGLAICRRLAHLLGGDVRAESVWQQGSTFSVTLPLS